MKAQAPHSASDDARPPRQFWQQKRVWLTAAYLLLLAASHLAQAAGWVSQPEIPPGALLQKNPDESSRSPDAPRATRGAIQSPVFRSDDSAAGPAFTESSASTVSSADDKPRPTHRHIRLSYLEFGKDNARNDKPTMIALHGSPGQGRNLERVARALSDEYRVIAPDMPGFGESERWLPDYSIRAHARYLLELMNQKGVREAHLFAHSMGSGVAQELYRLAPERVQSIVIYGGIGVQEGEGSGDYYIEHFKYLCGYGLLVVLPEVLPHFGLLGPRSYRHAFIRNFFDTDQRPLREIIASIQAPTLIIHGVHDPFVTAWTAEEHHRLIAHSELLMLDESHFMVFNEDASQRLADFTREFLRRYEPLFSASRSPDASSPEAKASEAKALGESAGELADNFASELPQEFRNKFQGEFENKMRGPGLAVRESTEHLKDVSLPVALDLGPGLGAWAKLGAIIAATFVSEDLTCISAGLLIRANRLDLFTGLLACFIGIFLGDLGLYLMGRLVGLGLLRSERVTKLLPPDALAKLAARFDREGWKLIFLSRFVPGTRFPVYTGAGIIGGRAGRLILIALLAGMIWTPALVLITVFAGPAVLGPIEYIAGEGWLALLLAIVLIFFGLRLLFTTLIALGSRDGRRDLINRFRRMFHIEFWPAWLFYAPLVPACVWFMIRYRGFGTMTASNPGIRDGGLIGESKAEILRELPAEWVLPYFLIDAETGERDTALSNAQRPNHAPDANHASGANNASARAERLLAHMRERQAAGEERWNFPIILKPDVAQRGFGLRLAHDAEQVRAYFASVRQPVIAQVYHPGPYECGVFYYRMPGEDSGHIFSITDKVFPEVQGDGRSTIRELVYAHPRYSLQTETFFERHADRLEEIPAAGTSVRLAIAGNHSQGTLFREGEHLYSEALRARTDEISRQFAGFFFGRYDVRYSSPEALMNGREFAIIELNGATSESTNLYDPEKSIAFAYRTLFRQWDLMFRIGYENRKRGHRALSIPGIVRELWRYRRKRTAIQGD
ncbi:MAG: alpha/beta fold hydrolase [bacterium]|nr:alpha/beta fold hydrolase [bacterium]